MINNTTKNIHSLIKTLALKYVARYFTTSLKLKEYLLRKLKQLNLYTTDCNEIINDIILEFTEKKYINDEVYSKNKAISLIKKGKSEYFINNIIKHNKLPSPEIPLDNESANLLSALIYIKKRKLACYDITNDHIKTKQKLYLAGFKQNTIEEIIKLNPQEAQEQMEQLLIELKNI